MQKMGHIRLSWEALTVSCAAAHGKDDTVLPSSKLFPVINGPRKSFIFPAYIKRENKRGSSSAILVHAAHPSSSSATKIGDEKIQLEEQAASKHNVRQYSGMPKPRQQNQFHQDLAKSKSSPSRMKGKSKRYERPRSKSVEIDLYTVDYAHESPKVLQELYSALCSEGRLDDALHIIKQSIRAGRDDALRMFKHYEFLRCAARKKSVHHGMRFVQLLPRKYVDARTYNMLVSVCAEAGDVKAALRSADMLKASGLKLDTILYTNLIKVCASAADADRAFEIFTEMESSGIKVEKHVYATMVSACGAQIANTHIADRRTQLVLLERAFELVESMRDAGVQSDAAVWNALITAAGRAGKLQRAFDVLDEMMSKSSRPNSRTYVALIDACAKTGDKPLALRIYKRAIMEGHADELVLYSSAINACVRSKEGSDVDTAMEIYADMQRAGVEPDSALYGALMMAAGRSGDLELVMDLHGEMLREGLEPCPGTDSALITIFVQNGRLEEARAIFDRMQKAGVVPHRHAMNAMINAEGRSQHLGNVISLVRSMVSMNMAPDAFTFAAILNACQRSNESELAMEVYRVMRLRGVRVDEVHALLLLRLCYSRLRETWDAVSSENRPSVQKSTCISRSHERSELLSILIPAGKQFSTRDLDSDMPWQAHACQVYRDAIAAGVKPSMKLLNIAMMCLKVPVAAARGFGPSSTDLAAQTLQLHAGLQPAITQNGPEIQKKIGLESVYHVQALSFLEEAVVSGHLPAFNVDDSEPHDLREYPPAVAEVYALLILSASQRQVVDGRRYLKNSIKFLVPKYDRRKVFMPSSEIQMDEESQFRRELSDRYERIVAETSMNLPDELRVLFSKPSGESDSEKSNEVTGLGVAGVLRRLGIGAKESGTKGIIKIEARDVAGWSKRVQKAIEKRSASALALQKPYGQRMTSSTLLTQSQANIRMAN
jgi:pentatricopeptide repeat protein